MSSPEEKNAEKKGRRKFRHEILKRMERVAMRRMAYFGRDAQIKAAAKQLTDRYMHNLAHVPARVVPHLSPHIPERQSTSTEPEAIAVHG